MSQLGVSEEKRPGQNSDFGTDWSWLWEIAGFLGWTPRDIKSATLPEIQGAIRGALRARGVDPDEARLKVPMTRDRLQELMDAYPDTGPNVNQPDGQ